MNMIRSPWRLVLIAAAVSVLGLASMALAQSEDFATLVNRLPQDKPRFAKRQQDLLTQRYDLSDQAAPGVLVSRGKPVQTGVRLRLPDGMS